MKMWMLFVVVTILCWGAYVPTLHKGQMALGKDSALRAFLFVGLAYLLVSGAVLAYLLLAKPEPLELNGKGMSISTLAGMLGAIGALGIVFALKQPGGSPLMIPPLVFAGAPIVNTFVAMAMKPPSKAPGALFFVGIGLAAMGAFLALRYRPT